MSASTCWPGTIGFDTKINVYEGNCTSLSCVTANDDASIGGRGTCALNQFASRVTWLSEPGASYHIFVHAFSTRVGDFEINVESSNDQCMYAIPVSPGDWVVGDTTRMLKPFDTLDRCGGTGLVGDGAGLWYRVLGTGRRMEATTCNPGTELDTKLHIFKSSCDDIQNCIGGSAVPGECSAIQWDTIVDQPYYILAHSFVPFEGVFNLTLAEV